MRRRIAVLLACAAAALGGVALAGGSAESHLGTTGFHNLGMAGDWTIQAPPYNAAFSITRGHPARTDGGRLRDQASALFRLQQGWLYPGDNTPRAELYSIPLTPRVGAPALPHYLEDGQVWCFGWSEYIPSDFPVATSSLWHVLAQWQGRQGGSPPLTLVNEGSGDNLKLKNNRTGYTYWSAPMSQFRGKWTDFLVNVDFDRVSSEAGVSMWVNGTQVVNSAGQEYTMRPDQDGKSYPKVGLYRADRPETAQVWVNGYRQAADCELADPQGAHP